MPRPPRIQVPDGTYHVTIGGCADRAIFRDDCDRISFETILARAIGVHEWSCLSLCLMTTHYHLLLRTPHGDLAAGMQRLNSSYASSFNHRYGTKGHVFQARYNSAFIQTDGHLLEVCRYIALNPVRAGICRHPAEWPWSSYAETIGLQAPRWFLATEELLVLFAKDKTLARSRFQTFVEEALDPTSHGELRLAS